MVCPILRITCTLHHEKQVDAEVFQKKSFNICIDNVFCLPYRIFWQWTSDSSPANVFLSLYTLMINYRLWAQLTSWIMLSYPQGAPLPLWWLLKKNWLKIKNKSPFIILQPRELWLKLQCFIERVRFMISPFNILLTYISRCYVGITFIKSLTFSRWFFCSGTCRCWDVSPILM